MKTTNYVIYRSNSSWLDTSLGTEKTSLKHATKIRGGLSELPEEISKNDYTHDALMYLYIIQSTKLYFFQKLTNKKLNEESDLCFGKLNSCFDNLCYKKFADKISMDLDINTFS